MNDFHKTRMTSVAVDNEGAILKAHGDEIKRRPFWVLVLFGFQGRRFGWDRGRPARNAL
jgi:hypothetical protein